MLYSQTRNCCYEAMTMHELEKNVSNEISVNHNIKNKVEKCEFQEMISILHLYTASEHEKQSFILYVDIIFMW